MKHSLVLAALALSPALVSAWQGPSFEVADIKPSDSSVMKMGKGRVLPGGRIEVPGYTVKDLIMFSWSVQDNMVVGGPKWINDDRFDIVAKAPADAQMETLRQMMQGLLADRFKLAIHREDKAMPAYVLTAPAPPNGLKESAGGPQQCGWTVLSDGIRRRECHNLTMSEFARQLPNTGGIGIDLPVTDQTGLKGSYDFQFEVGTVQRNAGGDSPNADDSGPTIFAALQKLGLRLESRKISMPVIVIDRVERPSVN
jgi:uncharacterized protein (TIGR03435 family)